MCVVGTGREPRLRGNELLRVRERVRERDFYLPGMTENPTCSELYLGDARGGEGGGGGGRKRERERERERELYGGVTPHWTREVESEAGPESASFSLVSQIIK